MQKTATGSKSRAARSLQITGFRSKGGSWCLTTYYSTIHYLSTIHDLRFTCPRLTGTCPRSTGTIYGISRPIPSGTASSKFSNVSLVKG
jgi:hypothetical protein